MMKKELIEVLEQFGDNTNIYVKYTGFDMEIENGDTFKTKDIEAEYKGLIISI